MRNTAEAKAKAKEKEEEANKKKISSTYLNDIIQCIYAFSAAIIAYIVAESYGLAWHIIK